MDEGEFSYISFDKYLILKLDKCENLAGIICTFLTKYVMCTGCLGDLKVVFGYYHGLGRFSLLTARASIKLKNPFCKLKFQMVVQFLLSRYFFSWFAVLLRDSCNLISGRGSLLVFFSLFWGFLRLLIS